MEVAKKDSNLGLWLQSSNTWWILEKDRAISGPNLVHSLQNTQFSCEGSERFSVFRKEGKETTTKTVLDFRKATINNDFSGLQSLLHDLFWTIWPCVTYPRPSPPPTPHPQHMPLISLALGKFLLLLNLSPPHWNGGPPVLANTHFPPGLFVE